MDPTKVEAILIANSLAHAKGYLDFSGKSNLTTFIKDLALMLSGVHAALEKQYGKAHPDLTEVHAQVMILTDNIMPVLLRSLERTK